MKKITLSFQLCILFFAQLISAQVSNYPYIQNFDSFVDCIDTCGEPCALKESWTNVYTDQDEWITNKAATPTADTGPTVDHTLGTQLGTYLYVETSDPCHLVSTTSHLLSPVFDLTSPSLTLSEMSFWYHMMGVDMGDLTVDISTDGGANWVNLVPPFTDNVDIWQEKVVDISAYTNEASVQFRFDYTTSVTGYHADVAIDDFSIGDITLGLDSLNSDLNSVTLYPNPAKKEIYLSNPKSLNLYSIEIYDFNGRLVTVQDLKGMGVQKRVDISKLATSVYLVVIEGEEGRITHKLIK
ncbi:T9SS type A sorting domain-containing protein [Tamlana sp. I1]|uniref:T9SS type A sorting domain-containing protein n=1 Tax=Tamlana sp. I1 TaxID=2762061 RepID=UPI00188EABCC|nr:T9SS type A sorting domain-containing protein [Tamlana sp. I1]